MVCGHGTKKREETRNFRLDLGLYSSEGSQFQCTGCMKRYNSLAGVHKHLETHDECGLRTPQIEERMKSLKKKPVPTKNFKDLYIKEDGQFSKLVYCNMSTPGYQNTGEEFIESSESHFIELEDTIDEISFRLEVHLIIKAFDILDSI